VLLRARQQGPWVIAIFWFVNVCVGTLVTVFPQQMLAALLVVVAVGLMRLLPLAPSLLSPTRLVVGGWQLLAAGGLLYPHVAGAGAAGISAQLELDPASAQSTIRLLLVAAFAVAAGAGLLTLTRVLLRRPLLYHRSAGLRPVTLPPSTQGWLLAGLLALPVAQVLTVGVMPLLKRPDYLFIGHGSTGSLAMLTAAAAVVCLGHLWAVRCHRPLLAGLCGWQFAVTFALSSRLLALLPPLFALGFASANPKRGKPLLAIAAWVGVLLVRVPLATRSLPEHGLLPYLHHLPTLFTTGWARRPRTCCSGSPTSAVPHLLARSCRSMTCWWRSTRCPVASPDGTRSQAPTGSTCSPRTQHWENWATTVGWCWSVTVWSSARSSATSTIACASCWQAVDKRTGLRCSRWLGYSWSSPPNTTCGRPPG
jgi:hypothetical protein